MLLFLVFLSSLFILLDFMFLFFFTIFLFYIIFFFNTGFFDGLFFVDFVSLSLMFISLWIFFISFFSMELSFLGLFLFCFMLFFIIFSFLSISFFLFYVSFELVFLFLFFYLLSLGSSLERIQASFYMFFYTLFFSFPFLFFILDYTSLFSDFFLFYGYSYYSYFFWLFMFLVFMVKLPVFGLHSWLLKAHVEAPVSGSMILAGVMLKLGGYGIIRFLSLVNDYTSFSLLLFTFFFYVGLLGSLFISILCFRQMDLKMAIAYSSIVHMSIMFLGVLSLTLYGWLGGILMMVCHGFISPLMFFLMGKAYSVLGSRSILLLKGFLFISSSFCIFWFVSCALNLGLPPFMSFFSEIYIIGSMGSFSFFEWLLLFFICLFTGIYCIYLFISMVHGSFPYYSVFFLSCLDFLVMFSLSFFVLFYPLFFFIVY
uniref:NADH-ubiquinone oxidoreductase chain 4 n=1 Tax=Histiostoma blomquisti TaxID=1902798 RepID=A0A342Y128_9ACAR|nr:NADH dehydrogenase subunit 4 [Histiostoma blomquisti]AOR08480.1 NADH dehydrogenase subunit 4 [Histiostoma blomquisti]